MGARGVPFPCCLGAFWAPIPANPRGPIKAPLRWREWAPGGRLSLGVLGASLAPYLPPLVSTYLSSLLSTFPSPCPLSSADSARRPFLNKISVNASGQIRYVRVLLAGVRWHPCHVSNLVH